MSDLVDLFPPGAAVDDAGDLVVGGCRLRDLAGEFGTPAYVVDEGALRARAREYRDELAARWEVPLALVAAPFGQAVQALAAYGEFAVYDLGGGLGARYTYDDRPPSVGEYLDVLVGAARGHLPSSARLVIEPGRSLVARAGVTIYRVVT